MSEISESNKSHETRLRLACEAVMANISYDTGYGTNCRFCDNNLDHLGTFKNMHAPDYVANVVRSALAGEA